MSVCVVLPAATWGIEVAVCVEVTVCVRDDGLHQAVPAASEMTVCVMVPVCVGAAC